MSTTLIRINKHLSQVGHCSRRQADKLIREGRVKLNNEIAQLGDRVSSNDEIFVDGKRLKVDKDHPIYIALNKPKGIVCTTNSEVEKNNIIDFINYPRRIFPVGRLDKDSEGLILLTNDGELANALLKARNKHEKEYLVDVDKEINEHFLSKISQGVPILGAITRKCKVKKVGEKRFKIILTQGLNRQIRRMCGHFGYKVVNLKRVRILNIKLDLTSGKYRPLKKVEIAELKKQVIGQSE